MTQLKKCNKSLKCKVVVFEHDKVGIAQILNNHRYQNSGNIEFQNLFLLNWNLYKPYTLVGPPAQALVLDPLAALASRTVYRSMLTQLFILWET